MVLTDWLRALPVAVELQARQVSGELEAEDGQVLITKPEIQEILHMGDAKTQKFCLALIKLKRVVVRGKNAYVIG